MGGNNFEIDLSQFHDLYIEESQRYILALNQGILDLEQNPDSEQTSGRYLPCSAYAQRYVGDHGI